MVRAGCSCFKDDAGSIYWLVYEPDAHDEAAEQELSEIRRRDGTSRSGWKTSMRKS